MMPTKPRTGRIQDASVPALLLALYRESFDGILTVSSATSQKAIRIDRGFPLRFEGELPGNSLLAGLVESGDLSVADLERVRALASRRGCHELAALIGLEALEPERLLNRLREHFWEQVEALFEWRQGQWRAEPGPPSEPSLQPLRTDPYPRIQEALCRQWSVDRLLDDLGKHAESHTATSLAFRLSAHRFRSDRHTQHLLAGLDGRRCFGEFLTQATASPRALATAWILDAAGYLRHREHPPDGARDPATEAIEIEIVPAASPEDGSLRPERGTDPAPAVGSRLSERARELRDEVLARLHSLPDADHYSVLGVARDAPLPTVKKAYFRAAKRYHPDAIGRHGLLAIKREASDLFSRIAEAWEILGDPEKRREYDHALDTDDPGFDADRLAQAETAYRKGEILLRKGDFHGAERFLGPAVDLWPEEGAYRSSLAWALYKKNPSEALRALEQLERAVELDPQNALIHFRLGVVHRTLGDTDASSRALSRARKLDPEGSHTAHR